MARAIYTHELGDPDYSWLLQNFREAFPHYALLEVTGIPLVLIPALVPTATEREGFTEPVICSGEEPSEKGKPPSLAGE